MNYMNGRHASAIRHMFKTWGNALPQLEWMITLHIHRDHKSVVQVKYNSEYITWQYRSPPPTLPGMVVRPLLYWKKSTELSIGSMKYFCVNWRCDSRSSKRVHGYFFMTRPLTPTSKATIPLCSTCSMNNLYVILVGPITI